ncbi:hypothetical protein MRX96_024467 [Rhipicephalus microplus]
MSLPLQQSHRCLDPGVQQRSDDTVDEDDGLAKSHDEDYEWARSHEGAFVADRASAALFMNDFRLTDKWLAALVYSSSAVDKASRKQVGDLVVVGEAWVDWARVGGDPCQGDNVVFGV